MVGINGLIDVGQCLGFHALRGIDHQKRSLARGKGAADFVCKVNMSGGVHQIQDIGLAVLGRIRQPDSLRFDGNTTLALQIHVIKNLIGHLAGSQGSTRLNQAVGQSGLSMIDMCDDGKIADERKGYIGHDAPLREMKRKVSLFLCSGLHFPTLFSRTGALPCQHPFILGEKAPV